MLLNANKKKNNFILLSSTVEALLFKKKKKWTEILKNILALRKTSERNPWWEKPSYRSYSGMLAISFLFNLNSQPSLDNSLLLLAYTTEKPRLGHECVFLCMFAIEWSISLFYLHNNNICPQASERLNVCVVLMAYVRVFGGGGGMVCSYVPMV